MSEHDMSQRDRDFWIAVGLWGAALVTVFGCGLYAFIEQSFWYGGTFTAVGLGGIAYLTAHLQGRRLSARVGAMALMLAVTWGLIGYQVWYLPRQSNLPQKYPALTTEVANFTPAWLTPVRQITFKSGVVSIINASGNLPPTKIETVAEPQTASFARALVDMFILSGLQPKDFGQGDYVGTPITHRLPSGITIVAPVPSLAAEALRVGFERTGLPTLRSTDHSRSDDYLVVEVGPVPY